MANEFGALVEAFPHLVWTAADDGTISFANQRMVAYAGLESGQPTDVSWLSLAHRDDRRRGSRRWRKARSSTDDFAAKLRLRRADGAFRWHLVRARRLQQDDDGGIWLTTCTDIEDATRAEADMHALADIDASLSKQHDRMAAFHELTCICVPNIADAASLHVVSNSGDLILAASSHSKHMNVETQAAFTAMIDVDDAGSLTSYTAKRKIEHVMPRRLLARSNAPEAASIRRIPAFNAVICEPVFAENNLAGMLTLAVCNQRDFEATEISLIQEIARRVGHAIEQFDLRQQLEVRARAAEVLDAVGDGVILIDNQGVVRLWNPAATHITGLSESEMLERRITNVIPTWPDMSATLVLHNESAAHPTWAQTLPIEVDGRELWLSISGVQTESGCVYAFRDLTDERAVERMRSDFVATVSHELRTPLSAIYGAANTLQRNDIDLDASLREQMLSIISDQSERLAEIVNEVLLASRIDAGHVSATLQPLDDVCEILQEVVDAARTMASDDHQIILSVQQDTPSLMTDPAQLRQIVANLVENAIKYSPDGGKVEVSLERRGNQAVISVRDHGIGIPRSSQPHVFDKFYRVDPDMNSGIGGTGLGLYICRELVHKLGGEISLQSQEGLGTTFSISLAARTRNGG